MSILENQPHKKKTNSTTPNQTHSYQTELNYIKPNSSIPNQTHPHQTELTCTKPNSSIPNQTKPDNSQPNLTNPNWLSMQSRTISSFSLLLALVFALVILQNCDSLTHSLTHSVSFVFQGLAERSSASQKELFDLAKCAAQLLYSPVLVFETDSPVFPYVSTLFILQRLFHHHFR